MIPALTTPISTPTRLSEGFTHSTAGLIPHRGQVMGVGIEGHGYGGVPKELLYELDARRG